MDPAGKALAWFGAAIFALFFSMTCLCMADSAYDRAAKRERLEMVMKQLSQGGCAPIQIELVRELAK